MAHDLQDSFEELIPMAAEKADTFLNVILQESQKHDLGLIFQPKNIRKTQQVVLEAPIKFGNIVARGATIKVVVHAEPVATALQVGWQLTEDSGSQTFAMLSDNYAYKMAKKRDRNLKPENQRKLMATLQGFHKIIFLPVMQMLIEAVEQTSRPQGGGFMGA